MGQSNLVESEQILENEAENLFVLVTRLTPHAFVTKIPNDSAKNVPLQKMEISCHLNVTCKTNIPLKF